MSVPSTLNDCELADALSKVPEHCNNPSVEFEDLSFHVFSIIDNAFERGVTREIVNKALASYLEVNPLK